jgi:hypothetical protein
MSLESGERQDFASSLRRQAVTPKCFKPVREYGRWEFLQRKYESGEHGLEHQGCATLFADGLGVEVAVSDEFSFFVKV